LARNFTKRILARFRAVVAKPFAREFSWLRIRNVEGNHKSSTKILKIDCYDDAILRT